MPGGLPAALAGCGKEREGRAGGWCTQGPHPQERELQSAKEERSKLQQRMPA